MPNVEDSVAALQAEVGSDLENENIVFPTCLALNFKIKQLMEKENCSIIELSNLIGTDPLISAKLLSVANARRLPFSYSKITSLKNAIEIIGFRDTHAIVYIVAMQQFTKDCRSSKTRRMASELWLATTNSSCWAFAIAEQTKSTDPSRAMCSCILSTTGQYILIGYLDKYLDIISERQVLRRISLSLAPQLTEKTLNILKVDCGRMPTLDDYEISKLRPIDSLKKTIILSEIFNYYPHPFIEDFFVIKRHELEAEMFSESRQYFRHLQDAAFERKQKMLNAIVSV